MRSPTRCVALSAVLLCGSTQLACVIRPSPIKKHIVPAKTAPELRRVIRLDKQIYLVREPIFVTTYVENTGSDTAIWHVSDNLSYRIESARGKVFPYRGPQFFWADVTMDNRETGKEEPLVFPGGARKRIGPGERSDEAVIDLLGYYGEGEHPWPVDLFLPRGSYTIKEVADGGGSSDSPPISFAVIEPLTKREVEAYALLEKAIDCARRMEQGEEISYYSEIIGKYPESRYVPVALYRAGTLDYIVFENPEGYMEAAKKLISLVPNSAFMKGSIVHISWGYKVLGRNEEIVERLTEIIEEHEGTVAAEEARKELRRIESGERE